MRHRADQHDGRIAAFAQMGQGALDQTHVLQEVHLDVSRHMSSPADLMRRDVLTTTSRPPSACTDVQQPRRGRVAHVQWLAVRAQATRSQDASVSSIPACRGAGRDGGPSPAKPR